MAKRNKNIAAFNSMRADWRKEIMADKVLGRKNFEGVCSKVARMRDLLIPKEMLAPRKFVDGKPRLSKADEFFETTGAGDSPVLWHILHNAAKYVEGEHLEGEHNSGAWLVVSELREIASAMRGVQKELRKISNRKP